MRRMILDDFVFVFFGGVWPCLCVFCLPFLESRLTVSPIYRLRLCVWVCTCFVGRRWGRGGFFVGSLPPSTIFVGVEGRLIYHGDLGLRGGIGNILLCTCLCCTVFLNRFV